MNSQTENTLVPQQERFRLNAYYSASKYPRFGLDSVIKGIVGRPEIGAGTDLMTMTRDIGFEFKDEKAAKRALARLKAKKIKAELIAD